MALPAVVDRDTELEAGGIGLDDTQEQATDCLAEALAESVRR